MQKWDRLLASLSLALLAACGGDKPPTEEELRELAEWRAGYASVRSTDSSAIDGFRGSAAIAGFERVSQYLWRAQVALSASDGSNGGFVIHLHSTDDRTGPITPARFPLVSMSRLRDDSAPTFDLLATVHPLDKPHSKKLWQDYETVSGFVEWIKVEDVPQFTERYGELFETGEYRVTGRFEVRLRHKGSDQRFRLAGRFRQQIPWDRPLSSE